MSKFIAFLSAVYNFFSLFLSLYFLCAVPFLLYASICVQIGEYHLRTHFNLKYIVLSPYTRTYKQSNPLIGEKKTKITNICIYIFNVFFLVSVINFYPQQNIVLFSSLAQALILFFFLHFEGKSLCIVAYMYVYVHIRLQTYCIYVYPLISFWPRLERKSIGFMFIIVTMNRGKKYCPSH